MTGDIQDVLGRIRAVLPARWFADETPVLDALLSGASTAYSWVFGLLSYVRTQARISTATDIWLDMIASDYFSDSLSRRPNEDDASLRHRIQLEILRAKATRGAVISTLTDLTGRTPNVFEPSRPADTGAYMGKPGTVLGLGYGIAGGWGSLDLPFQCFVNAYRPIGSGVASVAGWGSPGGGYGVGNIEYATADMISGQVTDTDIQAAVASVLPTACTAWILIGS